MALVSPGLQITVTDESQYIPGAVGTVPLVIVATEQDKLFNGVVASGTTAANAGVLQAFGSQRELVAAMGYPVFKQSAAGTPLPGNELNEYGLMTAYSAAGLGNRIYAVRADIDLAQLESTSVRPVGAVANGIYWFDLANSTFGINEWDSTTGVFTLKTPLLLTDTADLVAGPPFTPQASVGTIGSYAVVLVDDTTNGAANFIWYKNSSNAWTRVGSVDWQQSWPAVTGTVVAPSLDAGTNSLEINGVTVSVGGLNLASVVSAINAATFTGTTIPISQTNFTIEGWVYVTLNNSGVFPCMVGDMTTGDINWSFGPRSNNKLGFSYRTGTGVYGPTTLRTTTALVTNTWYYVAASCEGNTLR
jgi:hypothetical protein